jgi:hypothetical protein
MPFSKGHVETKTEYKNITKCTGVNIVYMG